MREGVLLTLLIRQKVTNIHTNIQKSLYPITRKIIPAASANHPVTPIPVHVYICIRHSVTPYIPPAQSNKAASAFPSRARSLDNSKSRRGRVRENLVSTAPRGCVCVCAAHLVRPPPSRWDDSFSGAYAEDARRLAGHGQCGFFFVPALGCVCWVRLLLLSAGGYESGLSLG